MCSFPGHPDSRSNHTDTIIFAILFGLLALASYWLALTCKFNPFLLICVLPHGCGLPGKVPVSVFGGTSWLLFQHSA